MMLWDTEGDGEPPGPLAHDESTGYSSSLTGAEALRSLLSSGVTACPCNPSRANDVVGNPVAWVPPRCPSVAPTIDVSSEEEEASQRAAWPDSVSDAGAGSPGGAHGDSGAPAGEAQAAAT